MNQSNSVEIIDRDGWCRVYPLEKNLIHIGSDAQNDIILETSRGAGVAPRQLQLIASRVDSGRYRLVNLGGAHILLGESGEEVLAPRSATDLTDGATVKVGEFTLRFCCGATVRGVVDNAVPVSALHTVGAESSSNVIGLELFLPQTQLEPDNPISGSVIVRNLGDKPAVQFKLAVEGLPTDCYDIGPGPLLFPGAEKEVFFRLRHPLSPGLMAGQHRFSVRAKAPEAYPGENAAVAEIIHVRPYYKHQMRLVTSE